jgi:predicted metal-dependent peptidase
MGSIIAGGSSNYRKLTNEQRDFFDTIAIRAMSNNVGAPYLRSQIVSLYPIAVGDEMGEHFTFAVDKRGRVYINFERVMELGIVWAAGGLIHECWHVLLQHFDRRQPEHKVEDFWAWATDMEINQNLPADAKAVMKQIYYPSSFGFQDGLRAEEYYDLLVEKFKDQQKKQKQGKQGQPQQGQGGGQGQGQPQQGDGQPQQGQGGGSGQPQQGQPGTGRGKSGMDTPFQSDMDDCGSAQHGHGDPREAGRGDAPERSEMDHQYTRNEVANSIQRAADSANDPNRRSKGIGTVPDFVKAWAAEILTPPKVRWQSVLRGEYAMTQRRAKMGRTHTNPRMPGRVQPVEDIMFPKRKAHRINVGIAFDSSGSNFDNLQYVLTEVNEIIRRGGVDNVYIFSVDADVKDVKRIRRVSEIEFVGGGGTDMRVAFTKLAEMKVDVGIVLTDNETPWPAEKPEGKTHFIVGGIVSYAGAEQYYDQIPDFLRKVKIDLTDK